MASGLSGPSGRELIIVADLAAADEPTLAHADGAGDQAGAQQGAEAARAGIRPGIGRRKRHRSELANPELTAWNKTAGSGFRRVDRPF